MANEVYEGASVSFRLEAKGLVQVSADAGSASSLKRLWARSHHLIRNNAPAATAKKRLQSNWIGSGIQVRWKNKAMQKAWEEFCASPSADGYGTMHNLQDVVAGAVFESGEVFTLPVVRTGARVPLKLKVLEAEMLDPLYNLEGDRIKYGMQFSEDGAPTVYHFYKQHPNETVFFGLYTNGDTRVPVPARDVIHTFLRTRPGQWRGVPWLAPVMLAMYEMDELSDATLVRQKAAQAIGWIISKKDSGPLPSFGPVSAGEVDTQPDGTKVQRKITKIVPGGVHYLQQDEDFTFAEVDDIGTNLIVMLEHQWHTIASALDLTYEQMTGDLSNVNFSSIRAGMIEFRRRCQMIQQIVFINLWLKPITKRFAELAELYISGAAASDVPRFILPKVDWVDPLKDVMADLQEVRAGFATLQSKLEERGEDFEEIMAQLGKEQGLDLVLDSNPKKVTSVGAVQSDPNEQPAGGKPAPTAKPKAKPAKAPSTSKKP